MLIPLSFFSLTIIHNNNNFTVSTSREKHDLLVIRDFENFLQFARYIEAYFVSAKLAKFRIHADIKIINITINREVVSYSTSSCDIRTSSLPKI